MNVARCVTTLALLSFLAGCATMIRGTTQIVSIDSHPREARCVLSSDDAEVGVVESTPGRATIKRWRDVIVVCRKDGYYEARTLLIAGERENMFRESLRQQQDRAGSDATVDARDVAAEAAGTGVVAGAAAGNVALVGAGIAGSAAATAVLLPLAVVAPVSMGVDMFSGAYLAYPSSASVSLLPTAFADAVARDSAFSQVMATLDRDDEVLRKRFNATCGRTCKGAQPSFDAFLSDRRAELVRQRDSAALKAP